MKTRMVYYPSVDILPTCEILNARCTCPAGRAPAFCKLTFALLHAIDDYIRNEMHSAPTERLQTWPQPKPTKTDPTMAIQLFKCKCTKASSLERNKFAFEEVTGIFATPFTESSRNLHNIRVHKTLLLPAVVCSTVAVDMPDTHIAGTFFFHQHFFKSIEEFIEIEQRTVEQNCIERRQERKLQITASDAKSIFSRVANFEALVTQILKQKK
ncbi:hypothetical protein NPIL_61061 [Nephila pilipes]|uniref:SWIM-type domain-containing protein n=1 Tax=Nephila pilipes TaxID=299642 RepID=A0A8X6TKY5_NEPPI|nr:hypothetical protein NPIL_61061 [Nephila pilipes]